MDEQAFRYNNRKDASGELLEDADRFDLAVRQIVGTRLTWDRLTGKDEGHDIAGKMKPIQISLELAARCEGNDQAERMDKAFRAVLNTPHSAVTKDMAKRRREREKQSNSRNPKRP